MKMTLPALATLCAGLLIGSGALAQSKTWNMGDQTAPGACTQTNAGSTVGAATNIGNVYGCTEQPSGNVITMNATAWSTSGNTTSSTFAAGSIVYNGTGSGWGVGNQTENGSSVTTTNNNHSMDNGGGGFDLLMLNFLTGPVALNAVTIGWSGTDADFQVLRWTGANAPASLAGQTISGALAAGWQLVSTVSGAANISTPDVQYNVNSSNLTSSYWLVSAFNSAFGGSVGDTTTDQIKVLAVTATAPTRVPEPASLALVGLALASAGVAAKRRRG